jgi:ribosomal protein S18 acetylase RimI-like enzyme
MLTGQGGVVGAVTGARVCGQGDVQTVVDLLVGAFYDDPTWSWVFPDPARRAEQLAGMWRIFVEGAIRYPCVWLSEGNTAVAVWIPPGGTELSQEQEDGLEQALTELVSSGAPRLLRVAEAFENAHPHHQPHYYLTLLGTDVAHRGHGYGLQLLAETLAAADDAGVAAYLEASNPVNVALYARYGFEEFGAVQLPDGGALVTTMWRAARA